MGTKFAPVYATLVVEYLEEKLYNKIKPFFGWYFMEKLEKIPEGEVGRHLNRIEPPVILIYY